MSRMPTAPDNHEDVKQEGVTSRKPSIGEQSNVFGDEATLTRRTVVVPALEIESDGIDDNEGRIVLRKTNSGAKVLLLGANRRKSAASAVGGASPVPILAASGTNNLTPVEVATTPAAATGQTIEDDTQSVTTTTSDVNSDDDAASIVSRLSQIVVEQEEKLLFSHDSTATVGNAATTAAATAAATAAVNYDEQHHHQQQQLSGSLAPIGAARRISISTAQLDSPGYSKSGNVLRPHINRVRSTSNVAVQQQVGRSDLNSQPPQQQQQQQGRPRQSSLKGSGGDAVTSSRAAGPSSPLVSIRPDAAFEQPARQLRQQSSSSSSQGLTNVQVIKSAATTDAPPSLPATQGIAPKAEVAVVRARTKSVAAPEPGWQPAFMRRNESSGFLPERGDLRALESSRQAAAAANYLSRTTRNGSVDAANSSSEQQSLSSSWRQRSHTAGSLDRPAGQQQLMSTNNNEGSLSSTTSGSGLMLNIKRSAWTLPEFDQTFNKSASDRTEGNSFLQSGRELIRTLSSEDYDSQQQQQQAALPIRVPLQERPSNHSLLIRASKNAIQQQPLQQQQQQQSLGSYKNNNNGNNLPANGYPGPAHALTNAANAGFGGGASASGHRGSARADFNDRRPSQSYSIVSFASSMDSIYPGFSSKAKLARRRANNVRNAHGHAKNGAGGAKSDGIDGIGNNDDEQTEISCCRAYFNMANLSQYLPILEWLPAYQCRYLWGDLMAGIAVAVLNISTSLSAAVVAETSLGAAFRASIVNTFFYALLCSSRHTSFGSWSIMSQMLVVSVRRALSDELILDRLNLGPSTSWAPEEYEKWHLNIIIMYTFLIGLVQLICGLLNLGNILSSFIPEALCSSMIAATAFTMAIGQLANMCGTSNKILFSIERNTTELVADLKVPTDITDIFAGLFRWVRQISLLIKYNNQINLVCVVISVASVILLFLNQYVVQRQLERLLKRKIIIPFEMIILIAMIIISYSLELREKFKVPTCGPIYIDFVIPNLPNLGLIRELWFESLATALISYTMVYTMAKTYSNKLNYEIDCNQELIACGAGNLIGGLVDALPATASFSRTASQVEAGGQTQMASIINCIVLVILAKLLGHHVAVLPVCVMAATLFFGFVRMMSRFTEVLIYWRVCKVDLAIWLVTFVAILTLDLVNGFVYGFIFSILTMLYRAQTRRCYMLGSIESSDVYVPLVKYPVAHEVEGIKIFQFCGPIHYVCADLFERLLRQKTRVNVKQILQHIQEHEVEKFNPRDMNLPTHIILDFSMISFIDSAGIHVIKKIIEDYQRVNVTIMLASLAFHVATVVKSEPSLWGVYKERFYVTLADAVHCAVRDRSFSIGNGGCVNNNNNYDDGTLEQPVKAL